jgi:non-reducing end alpha-L-arabinofuranosidase
MRRFSLLACNLLLLTVVACSGTSLSKKGDAAGESFAPETGGPDQSVSGPFDTDITKMDGAGEQPDVPVNVGAGGADGASDVADGGGGQTGDVAISTGGVAKDAPTATGGAVSPGSTFFCTPGDTRICVGPGACSGGQACLATGSWGACDCGTSSSSTGGSGASSSSRGGGGSGGSGGSGGAGGECSVASTSTGLPEAPSFNGIPLPCDVIGKDEGGAKCVSAHSTVRLIVGAYTGPLYRLCKGTASPGPNSCKGETKDIMAKDGYADVDAHEAFCGEDACTFSKLYDQSGKGNDLEPAPKGGAKGTPDNPAKAMVLPVKVNGHKAYGVLMKTGMGYRTGCDGCNIKKGNGMALGDETQSIYMVSCGNKDLVDGCCFDYGNAETTSNDDGNGTMEAIYFGGGVVWGTGYGGKPGPWMMADLENGVYAGWDSEKKSDKGISTNQPMKFDFVTGVVLGDTQDKNCGKGRFAIYAGDAQGKDAIYGKLACMYDGIRPEKSGYNPMKKQGSLILGTGGDNSSGGVGRFFEGATATGPLISKSTLALLHAAIVAAKYENAQ